jgi:3-methyladenine DNA glycosylase AlkD
MEASSADSFDRFDPSTAFATVSDALAELADTDRGAEMSRYMRGRFPFLGVGARERRRATSEVLRAARRATAAQLLDFADRCWQTPERELQYVATDVLREGRAALAPTDLAALRRLITTKSWWDTVDVLAPWPVGSLVERHAELTAAMDDWIDSDDIWLVRTALLHQLRYGERTDAERLFRYCRRRADSQEFFVRKAVGWALRQYARTDPEAVRAFVTANEQQLSTLSRREALRHL